MVSGGANVYDWGGDGTVSVKLPTRRTPREFSCGDRPSAALQRSGRRRAAVSGAALGLVDDVGICRTITSSSGATRGSASPAEWRCRFEAIRSGALRLLSFRNPAPAAPCPGAANNARGRDRRRSQMGPDQSGRGATQEQDSRSRGDETRGKVRAGCRGRDRAQHPALLPARWVRSGCRDGQRCVDCQRLPAMVHRRVAAAARPRSPSTAPTRSGCARTRPRSSVIVFGISAVVVMLVVLFPQMLASLLADWAP